MMESMTGIDLPAGIDPADARALAHALRRVYEAVSQRLEAENAASPLVEKVTGHIGCSLAEVVTITEQYPRSSTPNSRSPSTATWPRTAPTPAGSASSAPTAAGRAMDGVSGDADVTFVLTTNRAEVLERALVQRPGRIDLAVEIPLPDARERERLIRRYARNRPIEADLAAVVAATEGVTATSIKELLRRVVLLAIRANEHALRDEHFATALEAMSGADQALTRALLGGREGRTRLAEPEDPAGRDEGEDVADLDVDGEVAGPAPAGRGDRRRPARLQPPTC